MGDKVWERDNRPDRFVSNDDFRPVVHGVCHGLQLFRDDVDGAFGFSLLLLGQPLFLGIRLKHSKDSRGSYLQCLAHTQDDAQPAVKCGFRLARDELIENSWISMHPWERKGSATLPLCFSITVHSPYHPPLE